MLKVDYKLTLTEAVHFKLNLQVKISTWLSKITYYTVEEKIQVIAI